MSSRYEQTSPISYEDGSEAAQTFIVQQPAEYVPVPNTPHELQNGYAETVYHNPRSRIPRVLGFLQYEHERASEAEKAPIRSLYLETFAGLDQFYRQSSGNPAQAAEQSGIAIHNIIDMVAIQPPAVDPIPPAEARERITEFRDRVKAVGIERLPPEYAAAKQSADAIAYFLRIVENSNNGKPLPSYREQVRLIAGLELKAPSLDELEERKRGIAYILEALHGKTNIVGDANLRTAYEAYKQENAITVSSEDLVAVVRNEIIGHAKTQFAAMENVTGIDFSPLYTEGSADQIAFEVVQKDEPWTMWSQVLPSGQRIVYFNAHERQMSLINHGALEGYTWHEGVMHQGSNFSQAQEIAAGRLDPIAGYLLMPSPLHTKEEGIAMRGNRLMSNEGFMFSPDAMLFQEVYGMYVIARGDALFDMHTEGLSLEQAAEKYRPYVLLKPFEYFVRDLDNGSSSPMWGPYFEQYKRGEQIMTALANRTGKDPYSAQRLRTLLTRPMTSAQFVSHVKAN